MFDKSSLLSRSCLAPGFAESRTARTDSR